ncbi:hypothetical protein ILUMI_15682 [Ignelater luminosus]|uniref:Uncharacterized protein n=1 Tax=Ignelater luminosus TaxID=2038154 RepID=A0A8K0G9A3_IGNLU|nr:hypothetical protein ILUMI_15682 [Ignelater luminosus]
MQLVHIDDLKQNITTNDLLHNETNGATYVFEEPKGVPANLETDIDIIQSSTSSATELLNPVWVAMQFKILQKQKNFMEKTKASKRAIECYLTKTKLTKIFVLKSLTKIQLFLRRVDVGCRSPATLCKDNGRGV